MRLHQRVRAVIALRLEQNRPHKEAIRRALALLALPGHVRLAAACTARTVDAIWHAAGDRSADFSWYTKRAILAAVYGATLLYWLRDSSDDDAATLASSIGDWPALAHRIGAAAGGGGGGPVAAGLTPQWRSGARVIGRPVIARSHLPAGRPALEKPAPAVMAWLVLAIRSGRVP